jgi:hypothetical protein
MPSTPLTIAAREVSARLSAEVFPYIEGNVQMLRMIAHEDVATMALLASAVQASGSAPGGMVAGLVADAAMMRTVSQWSGNIKVWPQIFAASGNVGSACDFLDALPEPPIMLGTAVSIGFGPDPLVSLGAADQPLNAAAVNGSSVIIEDSEWPSINGLTFTIGAINRPLAQFTLVGADTTAETEGTGAGATVWLEP